MSLLYRPTCGMETTSGGLSAGVICILTLNTFNLTNCDAKPPQTYLVYKIEITVVSLPEDRTFLEKKKKKKLLMRTSPK